MSQPQAGLQLACSKQVPLATFCCLVRTPLSVMQTVALPPSHLDALGAVVVHVEGDGVHKPGGQHMRLH